MLAFSVFYVGPLSWFNYSLENVNLVIQDGEKLQDPGENPQSNLGENQQKSQLTYRPQGWT